MTSEENKSAIEQILDAWPKLTGTERQSCHDFLVNLYDVIIPSEGQYSPLEARADEAKINGFQRDALLGDFWETQFCDIASNTDFFTFLTQRRKVTSSAKVSKNVRILGKQREDYELPDVLLFLPGKGPIAAFDVRHGRPFGKWPATEIPSYEERIELFGNSFPLFFAFHSYFSFGASALKNWEGYVDEHIEDYVHANKWSFDNRPRDWFAVRVSKEMETEEHGRAVIKTCVNLKHLAPLPSVLKKLKAELDGQA